MCEHCNDNNDVFLSERTLSKNSEALTGIGCYICSENKTLSIEACIDNTYVKPLYIEKRYKDKLLPYVRKKTAITWYNYPAKLRYNGSIKGIRKSGGMGK